jgi:hypothetical protein
MMGLNPIVPTIQYFILPLFGTAGGAAGCGAAATGGIGGALKLSTAGKSKGRHHPMNFFALTFGAANLFGGIKY